MPENVIERDLPGAGRLTEDEIREASLRARASSRNRKLEIPAQATCRRDHRRQSRNKPGQFRLCAEQQARWIDWGNFLD